MSISIPNTVGQGHNRKLLEQLEEQKKRLRLQASGQPVQKDQLSMAPLSSTPPVLNSSTDMLQMTQAQRTAIQHAHANSVGYFITQDSAFGNLILPVLPRFDK